MIDVTIRITEDPANPGLTRLEQSILAALGNTHVSCGPVLSEAPQATVDEVRASAGEKVEREPGKPRPGRKRRTAAEVAEAALTAGPDTDDEEPEEPAESAEDPDAEDGATDPEPDEEPEDDTPDEDEVDKTSVEYAVSVASDLLDQDKVAEVKAALKEFGIRKVSLLKKSQVPDFLAALGHG